MPAGEFVASLPAEHVRDNTTRGVLYASESSDFYHMISRTSSYPMLSASTSPLPLRPKLAIAVPPPALGPATASIYFEISGLVSERGRARTCA